MQANESSSFPAVRDAVRSAGTYHFAAPPSRVVLRLDRNEGPCDLGAAAWIAEALSSADARQYPDASALERALADRLDVPAGSVLVTAGGDEAIDRCARLVGERGTQAVVPSPTFDMIPRLLRLAGADVLEIPWREDEPFPLQAMRRVIGPRTVLTAVVSPDNPTGRTVDAESVRQLAMVRRGLLTLVDVAYREFGDDDLLGAAFKVPGTVCIGTFSKAYAMAGLRVGYAVADPAIIELLRACGGPFTVTAPSIAVAQRALREAPEWMRVRVDRVRDERRMLEGRLCAAGWRTTVSSGNFVFARRGDAVNVAAALASEGVMVRSFAGDLSDALRITCPGDARSFELLCAALERAGAISEPVVAGNEVTVNQENKR